MGYDPLAESRRLLAEGLPADLPRRLSRRHRFAVVAAGRRLVPPPHGRQVVLWIARRAPTVEAFAADGTPLASLDL